MVAFDASHDYLFAAVAVAAISALSTLALGWFQRRDSQTHSDVAAEKHDETLTRLDLIDSRLSRLERKVLNGESRGGET